MWCRLLIFKLKSLMNQTHLFHSYNRTVSKSWPPHSFFLYMSTLSTSQTLALPGAKTTSSPLYNFLPETQNPSNLVSLICSAFRQNKLHPPDLPLIQKDLETLIPHLGSTEFSRVLLRCQSESRVALTFFNWVKNDLGLTPDTHHFCTMVHILTWSHDFPRAMELLGELVEMTSIRGEKEVNVFDVLVSCAQNCNWDPVVFDMLIKAYVKVGLIGEGYKVFRKMVKAGFVPNVVAFNFLLNGLSKLDFLDKCWEVYDDMWTIGIVPNTITFNILTHVMCKDGDVDKINEFLEKMEEQGFEPDLVTYNTLIGSHCKKGLMDDAFYLYRIMYRRGVMPDVVTYTSLMNGLCKLGKVKEAHQIFHRMVERGLTPDIVTYNSLIHGYCNEGRMKESRVLFHEMILDGVNPDNFTCQTLLEGYGRNGQWTSALNMVAELKRYKVSIPGNVYNYLIVSLCDGNHPFAATKLLDRAMEEDGYEPNKDTYENIIKSLCRHGCIMEPILYKSKMVEKNINPSLSVYQSLISNLCKLKRFSEAEFLMQEMVKFGVKPDCRICMALVTGHCDAENFGRAEHWLCFFAVEYQIFDTDSYNVLMRKFSEEGDVSKPLKLQEKLLKLGFAPGSAACKYVLDGLWKGMVKEKCNAKKGSLLK